MCLSSYELGEETDQLRKMVPVNKRLGYIFNALDFTGADPDRKAEPGISPVAGRSSRH